MAYGSSQQGGYGAEIPVSRGESALGKIHSADGEVNITRPGSGMVPARAGISVFGGDVIETGAAGRVTIAFADGSQFSLAANTALALDETFSAGMLRSSALVRLIRGVFGFVTGRAATGRAIIDTPVGRIQGNAQAVGIGSLAFGALTLGLIHDLKAASADLGLFDDGAIDPGALKHGIFEILTKELHPRRIVVDDPTVKVILRPEGSGTVSVTEASNTPEIMGQQDAAYQGVYGIYWLGQHDPFIQQWGNPNDHASIDPHTIFGSPGSSTPPSLLTGTPVNDGIPLELTGGSSPNGSGPGYQPIVFGGGPPGGGFPFGGSGSSSNSIVVVWGSGSNGNWNQPPGWNTGHVPGPGNTVEILTPVTVTLNGAGSAGELVIVNGATLEIVQGGSLTMLGNIENAGTIILDDPTLNISGTVKASGGGVISMMGASTFNVIAGVPNTGATFENVDNTISGSGIIGQQGDGNLTFVNDKKGTVNANVGGDGIHIDTGHTDTNAGIFEASNGGTLTVSDALLNSGKLEANGGTIDVAGAVTGSGSASVSGGGTFEIGSTDAEAFAFLGAGTLKLDAGSDFTGHVTLATGAVIDLAGISVSNVTLHGSTLFVNGAPATFTISALPAGDTLAFKSDGAGGTDVVVQAKTLLTGDGLGGQIVTSFQYLHYSVLDAASQAPDGTFTATDVNYNGNPNPGLNQSTVSQFLSFNGQGDGTTIHNNGETNVGAAGVGNLYVQTDGYIALKAGVTYTFKLDSDDGAVLSLNGAVLIDRDGPHDDSTPTTVSFTPTTTGFYEIGISYYANGFGGSELQAQYSTDGTTFNDLTSAVLSHNSLETAVGDTVTMSNAVTDGALDSTVTITGLPDGLNPHSFSGGHYDANTGTWTGTAAQFNALTFGAGQAVGTYDLTITATENGNPSNTATGAYALVVTETNTWTGQGNDGSWSDPANWSLHSVPGPNDRAAIETSGTVVVMSNAAADSLTLGPDSQLEVTSGHTLALAGPDESHLLGTVHVAGGGTLADDWSAQLAGTIDGGGTLKIGDVGGGIIASLSVDNGDCAIIEDINVKGAGSINVGTQVLATPNTDATALTLEGTTVNGGYINIGPNATLFAENDYCGNGDTLNGVNVDNAGTIQIDEATGTVVTLLTIVDTTVTGGNLSIGNTGKLQVEGSSTLDDVAVTNHNEIHVDASTSGAILVLDDGTSITGGTLDIGCVGEVEIGSGPVTQGATFDNLTVDNFGSVQIEADAALTIAGSVTLDDGGTVTLMTGDPASIIGVDDSCGRPAELDNVDNTIQGAGQIGAGDGQLKLVNEVCGVVDANSSGHMLLLDTGHTIFNAGMLEATSGGTLQIDDNVCNTHCGVVSASGDGSLVNLLNVTITGGTIETDSGGWVQTVTDAHGCATTSTFDGVTIACGSNVQVSDGTSLALEHSIDNHGTIYLGGAQMAGGGGQGENPDLIIDNCVTLNGHGNIFLTESTFTNEDSIVSGDHGGTLTNVNNTISGGGTIGDCNLTLINQSCGTIDADMQYNALILDTGSNCITNKGLLESTNYGDLVIHSTLDNSCGTIAASGGGYVQVEHAIHGGQATIADGTVEFDAYANTATSFTCGDQGALVIGAGSCFAGTVSNFAAGDAIDFLGINFSNCTQLNYCAANGTLTVSDGQGDSQTVKLSGDYCQPDFQLFNDGSGHAAITVLQSDPGSDNWITDSTTGNSYQNSYQYVSDSTASWLIAEAGAVSAGGNLASITDTEQNSFILNNVTQGHTAWLGGSDQEAATGSDHATNWYWVAGPDAGSSFTYANWNTDNPTNPEPNNLDHPPYNAGEHFLELLSDGTWNDEQGPIFQAGSPVHIDGYVIEQSASVSAGVVLDVDPYVVPGTSNVIGNISFSDPHANDAFDASVTAKGAGYVGEVSLAPVTQNGGSATLGFEFDLGNDQINVAPGQTLTQSYGLTVTDHSGLTVHQTVSVSFGGPGTDNFVFTPGIGADTIVNFNSQADTIELDGFANVHNTHQLASLISNDAHGDAVIDLGHHDSITVAGMTAVQLQAHLSSFVHLH